MNIKLLKLVSGEEIIAELDTQNSNAESIHIKNPVIMAVVGDRAMASRWLFPLCTTTDFYLRYEHIITTVSPQEEIINMYNQQFGSGLQIAKKPGLVLPV